MSQTFNAVNGVKQTVSSGSPNGLIAGNVGDQYFDNSGFVFYICTTAGTSSTTVWTAQGGSSTTSNTRIQITAATTTSQTGTYSNGTAGVGATFTWTATGSQTIDSQTVVLNGIYGLFGQTPAYQNGIYLCTTAPAPGVQGVLTRAINYNTPGLILSNLSIIPLNGALYGGLNFVLDTSGISTSLTIGTTALNYTLYAYAKFFATNSLMTGNSGNGNNLTILSGSSANQIIYSTGANTFAVSSTTPAGLTIPQPLIQGVTNGSNAPSGYVGELISSVIASSSAASLTQATPQNLTSISLTSGDWDVWGNVGMVPPSGQGAAYALGWISQTSATQPDASLITYLNCGNAGFTINTTLAFTVPQLRFNVSSTTTIYLTINLGTGGTYAAFGGIYARRIR